MRLTGLALLTLVATTSVAQAQMPPFGKFKPYAVTVDPASGSVYTVNLAAPVSVEIFDRGTNARRSVLLDNAQSPALDAARGRLYVPVSLAPPRSP